MLKPMKGLQWMGERRQINHLDAESPSQGLLNSMGVFVRASFREDGLSFAGQGGLESSASS